MGKQKPRLMVTNEEWLREIEPVGVDVIDGKPVTAIFDRMTTKDRLVHKRLCRANKVGKRKAEDG